MTTDYTGFIPGVTRVVCPGGIAGTVEAISARPGARWPVLVKRDDGQSKSYAPAELTRIERQVRKETPYP